MNMVRVLKALGPIDARNVRRDSMLAWMALMPFFFVFLFRFFIPWVRDGLLVQFGFDLAPYYVLIMSYAFIIGTPTLFGVVIGFLLLDEQDDGTLTALQVTPMPLNSYLLYRVAVPMLISLVLTTLTFPLAKLVTFPIEYLFWVALLAAPLAPIFALFLAVTAKNKVQGFAVMKGAGAILVLPLIGYFVQANWQWVFGLIPTYWPLKVYWTLDTGEPGAWLYFLIGAVYQAVLLVIFMRRFDTVMHR
jgi:fluoroquinolone transport system permease protein